MFRGRLIDCYTQNWHDTINNSSRCHHYCQYKSLLNIERYLSLELPIKYKIAFAKFRCSNHKLFIETGRHYSIPLHERICNFCLQNYNMSFIECEFHAFFHCRKYTHIRNEYLSTWYNSGTELDNFYELMATNDDTTIRKLSVYIFHLMNCIKD